ncbi:MAG: transpeptidase family protein [Bacteroidales bacterium]|nr:transpeptidase family protein [Bacteroidales bacterium]
MKQNVVKVALAYVVFLVIAITAVARMVDLQYFEDDIKTGVYSKKTIRDDAIEPVRGSILAADGRHLAFSTPEYFIGLDCTVASDSIFEANVRPLAEALSKNYGERSVEEYVNLLTSRRAAGKGYTRLLKKHIGYDEMKAVSQYPLLCLGRAYGGLLVDQIDHREYPYDKLAYRALGYLRSSEDRPRIGVEGALDSVLRGTPGVRPMRLIDKGIWIPDAEKTEIPATNGQDVQISIDIDMQDIAQRALLRKIENEPDLEAGTVIVMEVATGEIRAMVNMEKDEHGKFTEQYNYAIGRLGEPGSVFKLATLVTALEDKKVTLDTYQPADVFWHYYRVKKPFEDTYLRNYSTISIRKGLEISSNNVFRRIAGEKYDKNPQEFVDKLNNERRISYNYDFDLPGMGKARIRDPKDKTWSPADLPQIGMGYAVQVTPLHILNFYNAIANDGVMVKPHLFVNLQRGGHVEYTYPIETIGRVCSKETAAQAKEALRGVVIGENGTARRAFADCKVHVAGKTGTARISLPQGGYMDASGRKRHQGSFVGFFPYENPKYSIIVVVYSRLAAKNFYGGTWGGPVACEIINNIYASSPDWNTPILSSGSMPQIAETKHVSQNDTIHGVPNVIGMGLRDAVYLLESQGYKVESTGRGKIVAQSPAAGSLINISTDCVTLSLAEKI